MSNQADEWNRKSDYDHYVRMKDMAKLFSKSAYRAENPDEYVAPNCKRVIKEGDKVYGSWVTETGELQYVSHGRVHKSFSAGLFVRTHEGESIQIKLFFALTILIATAGEQIKE